MLTYNLTCNDEWFSNTISILQSQCLALTYGVMKFFRCDIVSVCGYINCEDHISHLSNKDRIRLLGDQNNIRHLGNCKDHSLHLTQMVAECGSRHILL